MTLNGDHFNLGKVKLSIRAKKTGDQIYGATVTALRHSGQAGGSLGVMTVVGGQGGVANTTPSRKLPLLWLPPAADTDSKANRVMVRPGGTTYTPL